ncbi:histidine phosphatase family protein [Hyphomonas sp.]|uniref:histidine phosphatase family protein n=1 Tax=Hyphomonas sp. TaxID=87 RepID=UPI000A566242|nr:histidine phosphatase family protein [Hyphomonas sp.]
MIYLIRHGEAAAGWGDHPDPGLSALGAKQAEAVAAQLNAFSITNIISSPMQRCRETSAPLSGLLSLTPAISPQVSEIGTPPNIEDRVTWLRNLMAGTWTEAGPSFVDWRARMGAFIDALPPHTAVFSHFVAINALCGLLEGDDQVTVFRPGHCSVTRLERRGAGLRVAEYGSEAATRVL